MARVTIYDVADAAGVSYQTVSRVLNDRPDVAADTRERVKKTMAELGYVPHGAARLLGSGRYGAIGLLLPDFAHPYWSRVARGAQSFCSDANLAFLLGDSRDNLEEERRQFRIMIEHGIGGIVVYPCSAQSEVIAEAVRHGLPTVAIRSAQGCTVDVARIDDAGGARALTQLLLSRGYRRIGLLTGTPTAWHTLYRHEGYASALRGAGIPLDEALVRSLSEYTADAGTQSALELLDMPEPPDALVTAGPTPAIGALKALEMRGIRVPDQMAVVAYTDGVKLPDHVTYAACEPVDQVGRRATEMLVERIDGYDGPPREFVLSYQIYPNPSSG